MVIMVSTGATEAKYVFLNLEIGVPEQEITGQLGIGIAVEAWMGWLGEPVQPQSSLIFCGGFHNKIGIQYLEDNFIKFGTRVSIALTVRLTIT